MRFRYDELSFAPLLVNSIYEGGSKGNPVLDDPLTKLFKLDKFSKSVGNMGGFRKSLKEFNGKKTKEIAYCVIFTTGKIEEWPDFYDKSTGTFIYYGDNRIPGNHYLNTKQKGNVFLKDIFNKAYDSVNSRINIPPIFVFESTGVGSNVEFLGVAVPGVKGKTFEQSLQLETYGKPPNQFQNFKAHFTIINLEPSGVSKEWLAQLKDINGDTLKSAPKEWINFVENGPEALIPLDLSNTETIDNSPNIIISSEKQYLQKVRTTQGKFRESLLKYAPSCKICGMDISNLLIASHIKPWKDCNDIERLDFYNGLLLCPAHNAAFDSGYISFDNQGKIIISNSLNQKNKKLLQINENIQIHLESRHLYYMEWHIKNVFKYQ